MSLARKRLEHKAISVKQKSFSLSLFLSVERAPQKELKAQKDHQNPEKTL